MKHSCWRGVFLFLVMIPNGVTPAELGPRLSQFVHQSWDARNGLPQNSITCIAQTPDGYLWLGTRIGLARFDGISFAMMDHDSLLVGNHHIWSLLVTRDSTLWIGTDGSGLIQFKDGHPRAFGASDGLVSDNVWSLYEARNGDLWVGTGGGGVHRYRNGSFEVFDSDNGLVNNYIWTIAEDAEGGIWVGTDGGGVSRIFNNLVRNYSEEDGFPGDYILTSLSSRTGLWFGSAGSALVNLKNQKRTAYDTRHGLPNLVLWSLLEDPQGNLWIGSDAGLTFAPRGVITKENLQYALEGASVSAIFRDYEGNIWAGTRGNGLHRFRQGRAVPFTTKQGLSADFTYAVYEDARQNLWIGTNNGGLNRFRDGKFHHVTMQNGLSHNIILSLTGQKDGTIWVGTDGGGLNRLRNGVVKVYTTADGLSSNTIWSLSVDRKGTLWVGTDGGGLNRFDQGRFRPVNADFGIQGEFVSAILEDRSGALWVGTRDGMGVYRIADGQVMQLTEKDGLREPIVWSMAEGSDGSIWFGTSTGVARFKGGRVLSYSQKSGLYDGPVYSLLEAGEKIWMGTDQGIFSVKTDDLESFDKGTIQEVPFDRYGTSDGMNSTECSYGFPSAWKRADGTLWFATIKGVVRIDPANLVPEFGTVPVRVHGVVIDGKQYGRREVVEAPPGRRDIEIHFAGLSFVAPDKIRFRYMLVGYDTDWHYVGLRRAAFYTNLPAGEHVFKVTAANAAGVWNEREEEIRLVLRPYFYETRWFVGLVILVGVGAALLFVRLRERFHARREEELARRVEAALSDVKTLRGLLPICSSCKKIRDDSGYWNQIEAYITHYTDASFTHGMCPDCIEKYFGKQVADSAKRQNPGEQ